MQRKGNAFLISQQLIDFVFEQSDVCSLLMSNAFNKGLNQLDARYYTL
jgi:hypothetical protein